MALTFLLKSRIGIRYFGSLVPELFLVAKKWVFAFFVYNCVFFRILCAEICAY